MRQPVSDSDDSEQPGFQTIVDGFLLQPGLPFADVLSLEKINRIFRKWRSACKSDPLREKDRRVNRTHRIRQ